MFLGYLFRMTQEKRDKFQSNLNMAKYYARVKCKSLCHRYNLLSPEMMSVRQVLLKQILGKTGLMFMVEQPFMCDYGYNIKLGESFYSNHNLLILDSAPVVFGDNVLIGPNCSFYTSMHPLDAQLRLQGCETSQPITIGNNVWICGNVTVLPGVTIGENCVIGAGSIVNKDVPANTLAIGRPCVVKREISQ